MNPAAPRTGFFHRRIASVAGGVGRNRPTACSRPWQCRGADRRQPSRVACPKTGIDPTDVPKRQDIRNVSAMFTDYAGRPDVASMPKSG
ncbi:hypothetical protein GCM10007860_00110 [Chitiniphilus shinanonensis]|uniref:Uncharacterized protein n=1 Tax=Chitiniphilus shinanonensis TaxID=553088 RepID=A0ABQ6BSL6_9NEIS|nr:hypothetical protein GCM10007860_00110 [Chitiniphilus shinanonensis]